MDIKPTKEQIDFVEKNYPLYTKFRRGKFEGTAYQKKIGFITQVVVNDFLGLERQKEFDKFDGGVDLIYQDKTYDVKCLIRNVEFKPIFVHAVSELQIDYKVDGYIFCSYNKIDNVVQICGYIDKQSFLDYSKFYPKGTLRRRSNGTYLKLRYGIWEIEHPYIAPIEELIKQEEDVIDWEI